MLYNIHYEVSAIFFLLTVLAYLRRQEQELSRQEKAFRRLVFFCILANALDVATAVTISYAVHIPVFINMLFNSMYYIVAPLTGIYFSHFVVISHSDNEKETVFYFINRGLFIAYFILIIINLFTGLMFMFSPEGEYLKGPLFLAGFFVPLYYVFYSAAVLIRNIRSYTKTSIMFIISFILLLILGNILQLFVFKGVLFSFFCAALAIPLVLFGMETPDYKMLVKTRKELELARDEAQQANRDKNTFLANMSHEIRTPINVVMGMNEMIMRECKSKKIKEYAYHIENAGNGLLSIIDDILDISKIESGEIEIKPAVYDLADLVSYCFQIVKMKIKEKKLKFSADFKEGIPRMLIGDKVRIRQILINLLSNAVKYTHEGGIVLDVSYEKRSEEELILKIEVRDTGIGICEDDIKRLFQSFERIQEKKNRRVEGTGLGLAITGQLVELMGGTVEVKSEVGKGSSFIVEVPQGIHEPYPIRNFYIGIKNEEGLRSKKKYDIGLYAPDGRVLIVDDTLVNLKVVEGLLNLTGLQIDTALSGMESVEKTLKKKYHIIFMDHMMPGMDGIEAFKLITGNEENPNRDTPIIMLTANAVSGAKEEYLKVGFRDYLSKPIGRKQLIEILGKYLPMEVIERVDI